MGFLGLFIFLLFLFVLLGCGLFWFFWGEGHWFRWGFLERNGRKEGLDKEWETRIFLPYI